MTPKLLWGPFLIQTYNIEPLLAWAIKTTKVNTVPSTSSSLMDTTNVSFHEPK